MAFGANVTNCTRVLNYEAAAEMFNKPFVTRSSKWSKNERPLDNIRKTHMRVEQHGGYYDVVLYRTPMARYFAPNKVLEGDKLVEVREVWYNVDARQTSTEFNYHVLGVSAWTQRRTTDGRLVNVGFNKNASGDFAVRLVYVNGRLDVSRSVDAPNEMSSQTSTERIRQRKAFKSWLRPYVAMAVLDKTNSSSWFNATNVRQAYEEGAEFDPTNLVGCINRCGLATTVNRVYPTGDIRRFESPFMEVS